MMKKIQRYLMAAVVFFLWAQVCAAEHVTMSAIESPPFYTAHTAPDGKQGLAIDLATAAWKAVKVDVSFEFIPMARSTWSVVGKHHSGMLGTPEWFSGENRNRIEAVDLFVIRFLFFYKKDRFPDGLSYRELSDLRQYLVGSMIGTSVLPMLQEAGLKLDLVGEIEQNFKKLQAGRVDMVSGVDFVGQTVFQKLYPEAIGDLATTEPPFALAHISAIFPKDETRLAETFRKGLEMILRDGTYRKIVEAYYGENSKLTDIVPEYLLDKVAGRP